MNHCLFYNMIVAIQAKSGDSSTVSIPVRISAKLEKVAWISLFSTALEVPIAWALLPKARPIARSSLNLNSLLSSGDTVAPKIPVTITTDTVTISIPPKEVEISLANAVVIDFGIKLIAISRFELNNRYIRTNELKCAMIATQTPRPIIFLLFFKVSKFLYKGMAKDTVAGVMRYVNSCPPLL